jgi:Tfp pilus assembly protein PilN
LIPIVNVILANKISGIHINEFIYTSSDGKTAAISLSGISSSREVLMNYVKILDKSGSFKNVESPISNLAKDKDFDFSINLSVSL